MKIQELIKLLGQRGRLNYFVLCPDELGLGLLLPAALASHTAAEDIYFYDAETVNKERAREIEKDARMGARGGSEHQVFYIYSLQKLPTDSVGPLLKAVEDAKFSRFVFQAQDRPQKIHTLMSRSSVVQLPFMSKAAVLANMKAMLHDAKTADELSLYDGTLAGTIKALGMKDKLTEIRREMSKGLKGVAGLFDEGNLGSLAFEAATYDKLTPQERAFLGKNPLPEKRKIVLFLAMMRQA